MAEKKKKQAPGFSKDKNAFAASGSGKEGAGAKKARQRKPGGHQPRDADAASKSGGQDASGGRIKNKRSKSEDESRAANHEFFSRHGKTDEKETEYSSQREEARARRKHRQHRERQGEKDGFVQSHGDFEKKDGAAKDAAAGKSQDKKLDRLEKKAEQAAVKSKKARERLTQRKEYRLVRRFDEATGKAAYELQIRKAPRKQKKARRLSVAGRRIAMEGTGFVHQKISEREKENSGVEAAHKTERAIEGAIGKAAKFKRDSYDIRRRRVAALEKKQFKAETEFRYRKFLEENPEIKKKALQKRMQKQRIKREYAKALRKGAEAKNAAGYAQKAARKTAGIARRLQEFAGKHAGAIAMAGLFGLFFMAIAAGISSCSAMFSGGISNIMAGSYQSDPAQIDAADEALMSMELDLQDTIDSIETDYPDYDEYNYDLDAIGHNPFTLINYLSAIYVNFNAAGVDADIASLFGEMYELTLTPREETRTRTVTNEETGEEEEEEYTVQILDVELASRPLEDIVAEKLAGNGDACALYEAYQATHGALQQFYTPLDLDWYGMVSSYYGPRRNPITGAEQFHRGVDIAVPTGTEVYAAQDGTVTTAEYSDSYGNYVVIADSKGYVTKYAHMDSLNVSAGQAVTHGSSIGRSGNTGASTGSHLHIECLYNGNYYNPLFYFESGSVSP